MWKWVVLGMAVGCAQVTGLVRRGGEPLVGIRVWWEGATSGSVTDSAGRFVLAEPHHWPAILRAEGVVESLLIVQKPQDPIVWDLAPEKALPTQVISGQRPARLQALTSPAPLETWTRAALTSAPCCNLSEAFQGTALVDVTLEGGSSGLRQLRLLGFEPAHSPLLAENKPLSWGLYLPWSATLLPALWIDHFGLAKGIGSVLNGHDGLAGQVQVFYLPMDEPPQKSVELFSRTTGELLGSFRWHDTSGYWRVLVLGEGGGVPWESGFLQDHNGDGFLDLPFYQQAQGLVKIYRHPANGGLVEWEASGLWDRRRFGQLYVRELETVASLLGWGAFQNLGQVTLGGRRGWVWKGGRGLSLLWQGRYFTQTLFAGLARYQARTPTGWFSLLYRQPIVDTRYMWQVGLSAYANRYQEQFRDPVQTDTSWQRPEVTVGLFSEFTWTPNERLSVVVGVRGDWHIWYGWQPVPRLHLRWSYSKSGALRLSGGRAWRISNPASENQTFLLSSRLWRWMWRGWPPFEDGWSYGAFWTQAWAVGGGVLRLNVDGLRAHIFRQALIDLEDSWLVRLYAAAKPSLYQTLFAELRYEWQDQVRFSLSYKHQEVWWYLGERWRWRPLVPKDRLVAQLGLNPLSRRWQVDLIAAYTGWLRVPSTSANPPAYQRPEVGGRFWILTSLFTYRIDEWELQFGLENLLNYRQPLPVIASEQPFGPYFDMSLIWGPIMGRLASFTLRYSW